MNAAFSGPMYLGDAALRFKLGRVFTLGPHLSVVNVRPKWNATGYSGSENVGIKSGTGAMPGVTLTIGRLFSFMASLDYLAMSPLQVTTSGGWVANRRDIDLSGFMFQLGFAFRFFRDK